MIPIDQILSRIEWDADYGRAQFVLGYWDRVERAVLRVPLERVRTDPADRFALRIMDEAGCVHSVPYHRIVEVYRDGVLIWSRPHPP